MAIFDKFGTAYYFAMKAGQREKINPAKYATGTNIVDVSGDGGASAKMRLLPHLHYPMAGTDLSNGPFSGSLYYFGYNLTSEKTDGWHMDMSVSRDKGLTWATVPILTAASWMALMGPKWDPFARADAEHMNFVTHSGKLAIAFSGYAPPGGRRPTFSMTSDDGGKTFGSPVRWRDSRGNDLMAGDHSIAMDAGNGPFANRIYSIWLEQPGPKSSRLLVASSDNFGKDWTDPKPVDVGLLNDLSPNAYRSPFLTVTVNREGVVLISAYKYTPGEWATDANGVKMRRVTHQLMVTASVDGGKTFIKAVPVADVPTTFASRVDNDGFEGPSPEDRSSRIMLGDYSNIAADAAGVFRAVWMDGRTGVQQLWYAPISITCNGKPPRVQ